MGTGVLMITDSIKSTVREGQVRQDMAGLFWPSGWLRACCFFSPCQWIAAALELKARSEVRLV